MCIVTSMLRRIITSMRSVSRAGRQASTSWSPPVRVSSRTNAFLTYNSAIQSRSGRLWDCIQNVWIPHGRSCKQWPFGWRAKLGVATERKLVEHGGPVELRVFVEKPLAPTLAEARELVRLARERGLTLGVNHNSLYHPPFARLPESIEEARENRFTSDWASVL